MLSSNLRRFLKYSVVGGAAIGTAASLKSNQYQFDSIGIVRLSRAAYTVLQVGIIYKRDLYGKRLDKSSKEYKELKSQCHLRSAKKLLDLCCTNRGVYIKVGQHIAALDYLLPSEYVQTMRILHCHAPANPVEDVLRVVKEDLKCEPSEIFETFETEPIGTASLAQVHKATLKDGSIVAVKVQHPYVQGNSKVDMKTMEVLVKIMSWVFPEFKFQWLVDESKKNIPQELDFQMEGRNAERIAEIFKDCKWLHIPKIKWDLSSPRVLTMDFVTGGQVNDLKYIKENNIDPFEISDKLGQMYSKMIFIDGFVHSDPHPGNIFVRKSTRGDCDIILFDHGLYAQLTEEFRVEYANLWMSILNKDRIAMRQHAINLGIQGNLYGLFACMVAGRPWDSIMKGIDKKKPTQSEKDFFQNEFANILPQISDVLQNVNSQMLLVLKTNDLIRGIEHTLQTSGRMGAFRVMCQCCVRSIYSQKVSKENSKFRKVKLAFAEYWHLFKIKLYYSLLTLTQVLPISYFL